MSTPRARNPRSSSSPKRVTSLAPSPPGTTTYKLDQYRSESKVTPFVLVTDDATITVAPPTGETVVALGETPAWQTRALFKLLCGAEFDDMWDAVKDEPASVLVGLLNDMGKHFMIAQVSDVPGGFDALPS
jgi:hypothetical protein